MEQLYAELIRGAKNQDFYHSMAAALGPLLGVNAISAYVLQPDGEPAPRLQKIPDASLAMRTLPVSAYCDWAYQLDPLHLAFRRGLAAGVYRLRELLPGELKTTEFYQRFYEPVGAGDELLQLVALENGRALVFYFVRDRSEHVFGDLEYERLSQLGPVLAEASALHEAHQRSTCDEQSRLETWLVGLTRFAGTQLTRREQQVLQCVLLGMSVEECARALDLAVWTVKNHRKAAYRKLSVNNISELLTVFLGDALQDPGCLSPDQRRHLRAQWLQRLSCAQDPESARPR